LNFNDEGDIVSVDLDRNRAIVAIRSIHVEVELDQVRLIVADEGEDQASGEYGGIRILYTPEQVPSRIDVHGQRVDEAMEELENYLDRAILQDFPQVTVVHGHGTGVLRSAIHERLRRHPQVRRFRFGTDGEGGGAVTIIEFK
jgi:DNA mismatch repair protein MutS2